MAYSNIDQAVTLPSTNGIAEHFMQQAEHRRLRDEQLQKESLARQDALTKYVGSEFNDKDFLSGTQYDPLINSKLAAVKQKYADMIRKNPDISMADLSYQLQKDTGGIHAMASAIKNVRANIKEQTKTFDQTKGMDGNAIEKLAMDNFIYKTDEKGNKVLKDVSELDPTKDYVSEVIKKHPEMYLDEGKVFDTALKGYTPVGVGNNFKTEFGGVTKELGYKGELYPFQQVARDASGKEILDKTGKPHYELRAETAVMNGKPVVINGQEMKVMDKDVYQHWSGDVATNAILNKDLNAFNKKYKTNIQEGTPEGDIIKNNALYERLKNVPARDWKNEDQTSKANFLDKREAGVTNEGIGRSVASAVDKVLKANQKTAATDIGTVLSAAAFDPKVMEGAAPEKVGGKIMYNLTGSISHGWIIGYNKDDQPIRAQIYVDPQNPGAVSFKDPSGKMQTYKEKELAAFAKRTIGYNGGTVDVADKAVNLFMDASRKFKNINIDVLNRLHSEAHTISTSENRVTQAKKDAVTDYSKSGAITDLNIFNNSQGTVNGTRYSIKKITLNPGTFIDEATVTLMKEDGTEETKTFSRPRKGTEFKKFLENFQ